MDLEKSVGPSSFDILPSKHTFADVGDDLKTLVLDPTASSLKLVMTKLSPPPLIHPDIKDFSKELLMEMNVWYANCIY